MRLHWRRLHPRELDHELVWLCVTVAAAALGVVWLALGLPWPRCGFLAVTGLPCLTCGATRAAVAFLHGSVLEAWRFNPLVSVGLAGIAAFDLYALVVLVSGARRIRVTVTQPRGRRVILGVLGCVAAANWAYVLGTY